MILLPALARIVADAIRRRFENNPTPFARKTTKGTKTRSSSFPLFSSVKWFGSGCFLAGWCMAADMPAPFFEPAQPFFQTQIGAKNPAARPHPRLRLDSSLRSE